MRIKIILPLVTPSLNELLRIHFRKRKRLKQDYEWQLIASGANDSQYKVNGIKKRRVEIRSFRSRLLDQDNFIGGLKPLLDSLVEMDLLLDDGPEYLSLKAEQENSRDQRTEIIIEDMS